MRLSANYRHDMFWMLTRSIFGSFTARDSGQQVSWRMRMIHVGWYLRRWFVTPGLEVCLCMLGQMRRPICNYYITLVLTQGWGPICNYYITLVLTQGWGAWVPGSIATTECSMLILGWPIAYIDSTSMMYSAHTKNVWMQHLIPCALMPIVNNSGWVCFNLSVG